MNGKYLSDNWHIAIMVVASVTLLLLQTINWGWWDR